VARARALVGGRKVSLSMIVLPDFPELARVAEIVKRDLSRIGITVAIRFDPENIRVASDPAEGIDLLPLGWAMDFPDPANAVVEPLEAVDSGVWPPAQSEPPWLKAGGAAERVTGPARASTFSALDRRFSQVDVPMTVWAAQLGRPVFFAERVGCRTLLPLFEGFPDLASLCLRDEG
jgi:hypothetical protein